MGPSCLGPGIIESKILCGFWADWASCRNGVTGQNVGKVKTNEKNDGKRGLYRSEEELPIKFTTSQSL
jgi:hypothetical protein